jgi:DtxR family Mn-dependent transcriptional regulator
LAEHALKHLHHCEFCGLDATSQSLCTTLSVSRRKTNRLLGVLEASGLIRGLEGRWELTDRGRQYALRVIRVHRLWEQYLAEHSGLDESEWHDAADYREHRMTPEQAEALAAKLGHPRFDPHGAPIPTANGDVPPARGEPLSRLDAGQHAVVVHVEDEPAAVYAQLVTQGLSVGARLEVIQSTPDVLRLEVDGEEQVLAPVVAADISVVKLGAPPRPVGRTERLSSLEIGQQAEVVAISPACRGLQRRRLLDLGLVPGTVVGAEFRGTVGEPTAYRVRGALIALRNSQADLIQVHPTASDNAS